MDYIIQKKKKSSNELFWNHLMLDSFLSVDILRATRVKHNDA